jgi:hypothetical protein
VSWSDEDEETIDISANVDNNEEDFLNDPQEKDKEDCVDVFNNEEDEEVDVDICQDSEEENIPAKKGNNTAVKRKNNSSKGVVKKGKSDDSDEEDDCLVDIEETKSDHREASIENNLDQKLSEYQSIDEDDEDEDDIKSP